MELTGYGKWILGGLGWAIGGPIGAVVGFLMGSAFESMHSGEFEYHGHIPNTQPGDFRISLLILSATVMKADGRQMRSELDYIKSYFIRNFGVQQTRYYMKAFRAILQQDIPLKEICNQINNNMDMHSRLHLLHFLFGIALADGYNHPAEIKAIEEISEWLNISRSDYVSIRSMFVKNTDSAYEILELSKNSSDEDIKKAFRAMALRYHPDRVNHLGKDFQLAAKEKFQKINDAYAHLKKQRGF
jgi:DnaJ like chaperone protein